MINESRRHGEILCLMSRVIISVLHPIQVIAVLLPKLNLNLSRHRRLFHASLGLDKARSGRLFFNVQDHLTRHCITHNDLFKNWYVKYIRFSSLIFGAKQQSVPEERTFCKTYTTSVSRLWRTLREYEQLVLVK